MNVKKSSLKSNIKLKKYIFIYAAKAFYTKKKYAAKE
jgi:hypothetical protein